MLDNKIAFQLLIAPKGIETEEELGELQAAVLLIAPKGIET